jgi:8-oxo-dGTP pyrophosphatase MutT (NUDIX family)
MSFFVFKIVETVDDYQKNPWTTLSGREVYDNPWISLTEYQVLNPSGKPGIYGKVHFKNIAVGIVPIDAAGNTYLVGQFRYVLNDWSWEIPEGGGPLGTDALEAARRELKEETGMTANRWTLLQRLHLSNSVSDEVGMIYLAEDLHHGTNSLDETEVGMKVKKIPLRDAIQMVHDGEITDSLTIIGLLQAQRHLNSH